MPSEAEIKVELDNISGYVKDLRDKIQTKSDESIVTFAEEEDDGEIYEFIGHRCSREDDTYIIAAHPDFEFMSVLSFTSVSVFIGSGIPEEDIEQIVDQTSEDDTRDRYRAAQRLLNEADDELMEALKSYLRITVGGETYITTINTTEEGAVEYITNSTKIFPYNDKFGLKELDEGITPVVNASKKLNQILPRTIGLTTPEEESDEYGLSFNLSW